MATVVEKEKTTNYIDDTLIRLRRQYSLDETVSALNKKISEIEIELGKANAFITELEDEKHLNSLRNGGEQWFGEYSKIKKKYDALVKDLKNDDKYKTISNDNTRLHTENRKLLKLNSDLIGKNISLNNKLNNL